MQRRESQLLKVLEASGLREKIETLLYSRHHSDAQSDLLRYYVPNVVDEELRSFRNTSVNDLSVVVGPRGSGKSASIRNQFGMLAMPHIENDEVVVPFYFDNLVEKGIDACKQHILKSLEEAASQIIESRGLSVYASDIVPFVRDTKATLIAHGLLNDEDLESKSDLDIVEKLKSSHPLGYAISYLKLVLHMAKQKERSISRVFFVADDLESVTDGDVIVKTILTILASVTCLENMGPYERPSILLTIFCLRPATYDAIRNTPEVNGFDIPEEPTRLNPVDILKMFQKKLSVNLQDASDYEERKRWNTAFRVVENIIGSLSHLHSSFFIGITNYNLRSACRLVKGVLENSHWYELVDPEGGASQGAINLAENKYHITQAAIVRCLSLRNMSAYHSRGREVLPNIFFNANNFSALLVGPYLTKFCLERRNLHGYSVFTLDDLKSNLVSVFDERLVQQIGPEVVSYFADYGLLRKIEVGEVRFVSQPKLFSIWRHLAVSSVIIECYRDDTSIRNYTQAKGVAMLQPSANLGERTFYAALDFTLSTWEREEVLIESAIQGSAHSFQAAFGTQLVSSRLVSGVAASMDAYYGHGRRRSSEYSELDQYLKKVRTKVQGLEAKLNSAMAGT